MNTVHIITVITITLILIITAFLDAHHMKNMINQYGHDSHIYDAYKKGALMGVIKTILLMGIFYTIILSFSIINNNKIIDNYLKANSNSAINEKIRNLNNNILFEKDTIYVDSIDVHTYVVRKTK